MQQTIEAIYEDGVFKPQEKINFKNHQKFEIIINIKKSQGIVKGDSKKIEKIAAKQRKAMLKIIGIGESGFSDISVNHDKYLYGAE